MNSKPRLRKWRYVEIWSCMSAGYHSLGGTPQIAYAAWEVERMMLPPAIGMDALQAEFRSAYGLSVH